MAPELRTINAMDDRRPNKSGGPYIGRPLPRFEDLRLVRGLGRYTDDLPFPGAAYAAFVRSPHPHARILRIDAARARARPGVLAVLTGDDYLADGYVGVSHRPNPADAVDHSNPAYPKLKLDQPHLPLAVGQARHLGEAVAMVVAETAAAARDAAEAVAVEYETLPAVVEALDALAPGAPALWAAVPDNIGADAEFGDGAATRAAFERADVIVAGSFRNQRIVNAQMEPRSAIGLYDEAQDLLTLVSGNQGVHHIRSTLAQCFKLPPDRIRVICPDVGGGFGPRTNAYPEQVAVLFAARRLGRAVKWTSLPDRLPGAGLRHRGQARARPLGPHAGDRDRPHRQCRRADGHLRAV
jgi:aerobic carbon-monoxide dehydrogenase large subunit